MEKIRIGEETNRRKDFAVLVSASHEKVDYIFATGAQLEYSFSLVCYAKSWKGHIKTSKSK